ncbi:MAG: divalent-cation tolerance protein CutA [Burkholderiaceae bacterium]
MKRPTASRRSGVSHWAAIIVERGIGSQEVEMASSGLTPSVMLVLTNVPDEASADLIERTLLEEGLVACINRLPEVSSRYHWDGRIEEAREIPLLCKTIEARYVELERRLSELHPYDVPEIIAWHPARVSTAYAAWVAQCCAAPPKLV